MKNNTLGCFDSKSSEKLRVAASSIISLTLVTSSLSPPMSSYVIDGIHLLLRATASAVSSETTTSVF